MQWIKENIAQAQSFNPYLDHVSLIDSNVSSNPTLCVETCKSLIEGICKTILTNKGIEYKEDISFNGLVQLTISSILNPDEKFGTDLIELGRRMASVSQKIGEIRNNAGFVSHGMDVLNPQLSNTLSFFIYKITDTVGGFILNCYNNNRALSRDSRIHYEDCAMFNERFDNDNPLMIGIIEISASKALYSEDYEAYKETYFEYLDDLKKEETDV